MAVQSSLAANLPPEILGLIFRDFRGIAGFFPSLCRVCRNWVDPAQKELWHSVTLGNSETLKLFVTSDGSKKGLRTEKLELRATPEEALRVIAVCVGLKELKYSFRFWADPTGDQERNWAWIEDPALEGLKSLSLRDCILGYNERPSTKIFSLPFNLRELHIHHYARIPKDLGLLGVPLTHLPIMPPSLPTSLLTSLLQTTTTILSIDFGRCSSGGFPPVVCGLVLSELEAGSHSVYDLRFKGAAEHAPYLEGSRYSQAMSLIWGAFKSVKHLTCNLHEVLYLKNLGSPGLEVLTIDSLVGYWEFDSIMELKESGKSRVKSIMEELLRLIGRRKHPLENLERIEFQCGAGCWTRRLPRVSFAGELSQVCGERGIDLVYNELVNDEWIAIEDPIFQDSNPLYSEPKYSNEILESDWDSSDEELSEDENETSSEEE